MMAIWEEFWYKTKLYDPLLGHKIKIKSKRVTPRDAWNTKTIVSCLFCDQSCWY